MESYTYIDNYFDKIFGRKYLQEVKDNIKNNNMKINIYTAKLATFKLNSFKYTNEIKDLTNKINFLKDENKRLFKTITCDCKELLEHFKDFKKGIPEFVYLQYLKNLDKNFENKCYPDIDTVTKCIKHNNLKIITKKPISSRSLNIPKTIYEDYGKRKKYKSKSKRRYKSKRYKSKRKYKSRKK